jgi:hypothetical protein
MKHYSTITDVRFQPSLRAGGKKYLPRATLTLSCGHTQQENLHFRVLAKRGSRRVCWRCSASAQ